MHSTNPFNCGTDILVNKSFGKSYKVVKGVYEHLDELLRIYSELDDLLKLPDDESLNFIEANFETIEDVLEIKDSIIEVGNNIQVIIDVYNQLENVQDVIEYLPQIEEISGELTTVAENINSVNKVALGLDAELDSAVDDYGSVTDPIKNPEAASGALINIANNIDALLRTEAQLPEILEVIPQANAVSYLEQNLTEDQQKQARKNIGALTETFLVSKDGSTKVGYQLGNGSLRTIADKLNEIISVKDFGAKGDGITDDSNAFNSLEEFTKGNIINLDNKIYVVNSIPKLNTYINGKFLVDGIYYPTEDVYDKKITLVSPNNGNYNAWPQDTAHSRGGVLYTFYNTDIGHNSDYAHPVLAISIDGGNSFQFQQHLGTDKTFGQIIASAGITESGLQLAIMRQGNGIKYSEDKTYRLLARRSFEYLAFATDNRTLDVSTISKDKKLTFKFSFQHGLVKGDKLIFEYTNATVGGISISGEFTVTEVLSLSSVTVEKTETEKIPTANLTESMRITEGGLKFNEYAKFRELKVNGVSFGTALKKLANVSNNPAMVHSMCIVDDDVYCCVHGGDYAGSHIVKISNISFETRSLSIKRISTMGSEATLAHLGNRIFIGGLRPESTSYPARFFIYNENTGEISLNDTRFGANRFLKSPFPVRVIGNKVVFCFSDNRATLPNTTTRFVGKVPIYIAYASIDEILSNTSEFEDKLKYEKITDAFYANTSIGDGSAAGVPSLTAIGSNVFLFYSSEHPAVIADRDGYPNVYCCRLDFCSILGERIDSPIPTINGYMTTAYDGINRNYSTPDWQNIPFNITLYFANKSTSGSLVTQGLDAEFLDNVAEANIYFKDERILNGKRFSIGHNYYRVMSTPLGTFKNVTKSNTGIGVCYAPNGGRLSDSFKVVCRMNTASNSGTIEYGYGDVNIRVILERPINWIETT